LICISGRVKITANLAAQGTGPEGERTPAMSDRNRRRAGVSSNGLRQRMMSLMQPWKRRRRYFVRDRLRLPFKGYRRVRQASTSEPDARDENAAYLPRYFEDGLTPAQARLAQERLSLAIERRRQTGHPLKGPWLAAIIAGVVSAVKGGRVGNSSWGWSMHGKRGGQAMARRGLHKLREISPAGVRASLIARDRRKAREAFERDRARGGPVLPPPRRPRSFLES
jgi:hypothetical protein